MKNIKTLFQMMIQILREESDWDLMYYLESINTPEEALEVIKTLRNKLVDRGQQELSKEMNKYHFLSKENLIGTFATIVEKQRGYPLWMWEYSDIEDWAWQRALDNHYEFLFAELEPADYEDELFSYLNHLQFNTYDELCSTIRCWFKDEKNVEIKDDECMEFASGFVDKKELWDISYDDLVLYFKQ